MKLLVFGSLNIDNTYDVDHTVKQGETISSLALNTYCGGKGLNQAIAVSKAGADTPIIKFPNYIIIKLRKSQIWILSLFRLLTFSSVPEYNSSKCCHRI